jgi:predicted aspartyl protease
MKKYLIFSIFLAATLCAANFYTYSAHAQTSGDAGRTFSVQLERVGSNYQAPVRINDAITLGFILDSGADEVQIPIDVVITLIRAGTIHKEDVLQSGLYTTADGSVVKNERFIIRKMSVGDAIAYNVTASVSSIDSPMLLGQSFLKQFPTWQMNNSTGTLVLTQQAPTLDTSHNIEEVKQDVPASVGKKCEQKKIKIIEGWGLDTNCDGKVDTILVDKDHTGNTEYILRDSHFNGVVDTRIVRSLKDGPFDLLLIDTQGKGTADVCAKDNVGDYNPHVYIDCKEALKLVKSIQE